MIRTRKYLQLRIDDGLVRNSNSKSGSFRHGMAQANWLQWQIAMTTGS